MNVTQEIRENWKKLKGMSRKERASYIWTYYKFPILALVLAFCVLFSWIYSGVTTAETALSGILLNCYDSMLSDGSRSGFSEDFLEEHRESCVRIPMRPEARSLNLSNAVAITVYEALRQLAFPNLKDFGKMRDNSR